MERRSLFSFDVISSYNNIGTRQIEIPLLKNRSYDKLPTNKYQHQINCIVDRCNIPRKSKPTLYERLCNYIQHTISVINPQSNILLYWNILNLLAIFFNFIQIPIIIMVASVSYAYIQQDVQDTIQIIDNICLFTFIFDLLLVRYRIAYYKNQVLQTNVQIILTKYIKNGLLIDLIAYFVYFYDYLYGGAGNYVKIIFYIKFLTFRKIDILVQNKAMYNRYFNAFYRFIKMVGLIFFLTSLQACIYFAIDYNYFIDRGFNQQNGFLWLTASESTNYLNLLDSFNWPAWYIYALYWAVQTTSAVGYGNNTPRNPTEILLCNIIMLTTICIFVSFANTILDIVDQLQESTLQVQAKFIEINSFTNTNKIKRETKGKVKFYINCFIESKQNDSQQAILSLLPNQLQERFNLNFNYFIFNSIRILDSLTKDQKGHWNNFALDLTYLLKVKYYSTNDCIELAGKTHDFKLWMIQRGKVTAFNDIINYKKDFRDWDYFGQKQFFYQGVSLSNIISRTFTKLYYFQRTEFFTLMKHYPILYDKCLEKLDGARFNNKFAEDFEINCPNCDDYHLLQWCPVVTSWKDKLPKIQRNEESEAHERSAYIRKQRVSLLKIRHYTKQKLQIDKAYKCKAYYTYRNI